MKKEEIKEMTTADRRMIARVKTELRQRELNNK